MKIEKKIDKDSFELILKGTKKYEIRLNEFECKVGDTLVLLEKDPVTNKLTGRQIKKTVTLVDTIDVDNSFYSKKDIEEKGFLVISFD